MNNIIILGAPEKDNPDRAERNKVDQALAEELLKTLEIKEAPEKSYRVGAYSKKKSQENASSNDAKSNGSEQTGRPLKVTFKSPDTVKFIMENATKLASAPQHLKYLSVGYDISVDERKLLKKQIIRSQGCKCKKKKFDSQSEGPTIEPANSSFSKARANLCGIEQIKVSLPM